MMEALVGEAHVDKNAIFKRESLKSDVNSQPRVLFVGPMLGCHAGWVPNPVEILAPLLEREGYTCDLTSTSLNKYARLADASLTVHRMRNTVDVVCLQVYAGRSFVFEDIISRMCSILEIPLVMVLHGGNIPGFSTRCPGWFAHVLRRAHTVVTPSDYLSETARRFGIESEVVPNIVRLEEYRFRSRNGVSPHLLWMRTFYDFYNAEMAVRVLERLLPDCPGATLTLAGQDKGGLEKTKALVRHLELENHIRFVGFISGEAKVRVFSQHDIFLNTSRVDNMPVSLLEAAASGLPIVTTDVGGIKDMVRDEDSALLVPSDDVEAMSQAVRRLLNEPGLAERLSAGGLEVAQRCSATAVIPMWQGIFEDLTKRRRHVRDRRNS